MSRLSKHSQSTISRMVASVNRPDTTERATFLRNWLAKHQRTLAKGGLAASLTLPLMAQAATQDGKVALESIDAITDMARKQDGSLLIQLEDGRLLEVPAEHVTQAEGQTLVDVAALRQAEQEAWIALEDLPNVESATVNSDGSVTVTRTDGTEVVLEEGIATSATGMAVASQEQLAAEGLVSPGDFSPLEGLAGVETGASQASAWSSAMGNISPAMAAGAGAVAVGAVAIAANSSSSSSDSSSASSPSSDSDSSSASSPSSDNERILELEGDANFADPEFAGIDVIKVPEGVTLSATTADLDGFSGRIEGAGDVYVEVGQEETLATNIQLAGGTLAFDFTETDVSVLELTSDSILRLGGGDLIVTGGTLDVSNIENADDFSGVNNVTLNSGLTVNVDQLASLEQISTGTGTESSFNVVIRSQQDLDKVSSLDLSGKFSDDDGLSVSFKVEANSAFEQRTLENSLKEQENSLSESIGKTVTIESSPLTPFDFSSSPDIDSVRQYLSVLTNEDIDDNGDNLLYGELTDITLSTGETLTVQKVPDEDNLVYLEDGINYHTLDNGLTLVTIEFLVGNTETEALADWGYTQWLVFDEDGFITQSNSFFPEPGNIIAAVQNDDPSTVHFQSLHIDVENGEISYPDPNKLFTLYSLSSDNLLATLSSVEGDKNSLIGADSVTAVLTLGAEDLGFTLGDNEDVFLDKVSFDGETGKLLIAKNDANDEETLYLVAVSEGAVTEVIDLSDYGIFDDLGAALRAFDNYEGDGFETPPNVTPPEDITGDSSIKVSFDGSTADFSENDRGVSIDLQFNDAWVRYQDLPDSKVDQLAEAILGRPLEDDEWLSFYDLHSPEEGITIGAAEFYTNSPTGDYSYETYIVKQEGEEKIDALPVEGFPYYTIYTGDDTIYMVLGKWHNETGTETLTPVKLSIEAFTIESSNWSELAVIDSYFALYTEESQAALESLILGGNPGEGESLEHWGAQPIDGTTSYTVVSHHFPDYYDEGSESWTYKTDYLVQLENGKPVEAHHIPDTADYIDWIHYQPEIDKNGLYIEAWDNNSQETQSIRFDLDTKAFGLDSNNNLQAILDSYGEHDWDGDTGSDDYIWWGNNEIITNAIGSEFDDVIYGSSEDNIIRGLGGDDEIQLWGGGSNTIIFEPTLEENGTDRIASFNTGAFTSDADSIAIAVDKSLTFQSLVFGETPSSDTEFAVFTTGRIDEILESLNIDTGTTLYLVAANDEFSDYGDASLYRVEGGISEQLAVFEGLGDQLSSFGKENLQDYNSITM